MARRIAAFGMIFGAALSACTPMLDPSAPPPRSVRLANAVTVQGPAGYCIDPVVTNPWQGFALLAACAAMTTDTEAEYPASIALITVQVGQPGSAVVQGQEDEFSAFMDTPQGAALLSVSALGGPVAVRVTQADPNAVAVYTEDVESPAISGSQPQAWRMFTDVGDRLVTISVRGLDDAALSQSASRALLDQMLATLRAANAAPGTAA